MQRSEIAKVSQELGERCDNLSAVGEHGLSWFQTLTGLDSNSLVKLKTRDLLPPNQRLLVLGVCPSFSTVCVEVSRRNDST